MKKTSALFLVQKGLRENKQKTLKEELDILLWQPRLKEKCKSIATNNFNYIKETKKEFLLRVKEESYN